MTTLTEGRTTTSISKPDRPSSQRERLTAVQSSALHALRSSIRRLTVLAPTGSGKTYLFALCALQVLRGGGRILLLSASRACADEVSSRYLLPLAEEGYRTTATDPGSMQTGQFDAGATVYESALMALPGLVRAFRSSGGMVFFDDLEVARSRDRGPSVEAVLRAFLQVEGLRLVFMSAVMQADDPLINWLGGTVVAAHQREVELKRGVWRNGVYSFEEFNTALRGSEELPALPDPATGDRKPSLKIGRAHV